MEKSINKTVHNICIFVLGVAFLVITSFDVSAMFGGTINYADVWPTIEYETEGIVSVGVHDQRPYVINGEESPSYAGTVRGGFGNPWNVSTESDKQLSNDIAIAVVSGFNHVGTQVRTIEIPFSDNHKTVLEKLRQFGTKRIIIITLREWRIDNYKSAGFFIDAILRVYDSEGKELANSTVSHKNIGSGDGTVESTIRAARLYLNMLLNDPKVKAVLGAKPSIYATKGDGPNGRFIPYGSGTVLDKWTGLMWASKDNDSGITWKGAKKYCEEHRVGGFTDWRMPTYSELEMLYDDRTDSINGCITKLIGLTKSSIWVSEPDSSGTYFRFDGGTRESTSRPFNFIPYRALPVRFHNKVGVDNEPNAEINKPNISATSNMETQAKIPDNSESAHKLRELKKLRDEGLLTNEEYEQNKKMIIENIISPKTEASVATKIFVSTTSIESPVTPKEQLVTVPPVNDKNLAQVNSKQSDTKHIPKEEIQIFVNKWLASWQVGDMAIYRSCYASDFQSKGQNLDAWVSHKADMYKKSKDINISIDDLQIVVEENTATAVFIQNYSSSLLQDSVKKILRLRKINNEWKIYNEIM